MLAFQVPAHKIWQDPATSSCMFSPPVAGLAINSLDHAGILPFVAVETVTVAGGGF